MALYKSHQAVLDCIEGYWRSHNNSPTVREIQEAVGRSRGSTQNSLNRLKSEGYITWTKYKSRTIRLLERSLTQATAAASFLDVVVFSEKGLPILGEIAAGYLDEPFTETFIDSDFEDFLDISYAGRKEKDYVLRISGDSMVGAGIPDRSYVGIRPVEKGYKPRNREIVAVWVDGHGATLKHYHQEGSTVVLRAANPKYDPIILDLNTTEVTVKGTHLFTHWQSALMSK